MSGLERRVLQTGLLRPGDPVVVLLSGGVDSVCLLDLAVTIAGASAVSALHVDYGLRAGSAADAEHCRGLCERLGVALEVDRAPVPPASGNLQAWARERRYALAARAAERRDADVAAGHTATDQVETVLYRLAASPGRRALLGMPARDGRLVRPLLGVGRADVVVHCEARGLRWREDPSNGSDVFARNRARARLVPALRALHPAAEANVVRTVGLLRDEAVVLDAAVDVALRDAGWRGPGSGVAATALAELEPALRRLAFQRLADAAVAPPAAHPTSDLKALRCRSSDTPAPLDAGGAAAAVGERVDEALALATRGGTRALDLPGGLRAVATYGGLRVVCGPPRDAAAPSPPAAELPIPGWVAWGDGDLAATIAADLPVADGTLDAAVLRAPLQIRTWRAGDRMRPLGVGGSRTLQDLFTDRKLPREKRRTWPVICSAGRIAWVPNVATDEAFAVTSATTARVRLVYRVGPA